VGASAKQIPTDLDSHPAHSARAGKIVIWAHTDTNTHAHKVTSAPKNTQTNKHAAAYADSGGETRADPRGEGQPGWRDGGGGKTERYSSDRRKDGRID